MPYLDYIFARDIASTARVLSPVEMSILFILKLVVVRIICSESIGSNASCSRIKTIRCELLKITNLNSDREKKRR